MADFFTCLYSVGTAVYTYDLLGWIVFCSVFSCQRPPHPLTATSAPFLAGCLSLSRAEVSLGVCRAPHTVNFLRQTPLPPRGHFSFFGGGGAELYLDSSEAPRLKSAVWSMVITSKVLNLTRGGGGESYAMGGTESRAETDSKSLSCNGLTSLLPHLSACPLLSTCWLSTMFQTHVLRPAVGVISAPRRAWYQHTIWDQFNFGWSRLLMDSHQHLNMSLETLASPLSLRGLI